MNSCAVGSSRGPTEHSEEISIKSHNTIELILLDTFRLDVMAR